ncbi:MAG: outer membrane protein insertion porin family [Phormidesmis priestleyi Ana]|uniref:Outer membrane protein insertion porin family n=1 Tax=Phormidesmis priestleyi Ana TaxID=1666911 RepID=A0A0P7ZHG2_9CYAN|nr:MAG: outer membrane protein insertion porin family [Phormidesmis priestleyi Ana]
MNSFYLCKSILIRNFVAILMFFFFPFKDATAVERESIAKQSLESGYRATVSQIFALEIGADKNTSALKEEDSVGGETEVKISHINILSELEADLSQQLINSVHSSLSIEEGSVITDSILSTELKSIFNTGFFSNVRAITEATSSGVELFIYVSPNPVLSHVEIFDKRVLPESVIANVYGDKYGKTINFNELRDATIELNNWYQENGYLVATVDHATTEVDEEGIVTIRATEGEIDSVDIQFVDDDEEAVNEKGEPIVGKTLSSIIFERIDTRPGDIVRKESIQEDITRLLELDVFQNISADIEPLHENPQRYKVIFKIEEKGTTGIGASLRINLKEKLLLNISYEKLNYAGRAQKISIKSSSGSTGLGVELSIENIGAREDATSKEQSLAKEVAKLRDDEMLNTAIKKTIEIIDIYKNKGSEGYAALALNNLGNLYIEKERNSKAINSFQEAISIFKELDSHGLELLMHVSIANAYKREGNPKKALEEYNAALLVLNILEEDTDLSFILGDEIFNILESEWGIENRELDPRLSNMIPAVRGAIILSIASIYSSIGDYQQAIYIANSFQLENSSNSLGDTVEDFIEIPDALPKKKNIHETSFEDTKELISSFVLNQEFVENFREKLVNSVDAAPYLMRSVALQLIYEDLEESELSTLYANQIFDGYNISKEAIFKEQGNTWILLDELSKSIIQNIHFFVQPEEEEEVKENIDLVISFLKQWLSGESLDINVDVLETSLRALTKTTINVGIPFPGSK